jgi:DNA modification methylase
MLLKGDCRQQLATLPENSVHAIITDPPYELGFMGKTWDSTGIAYNVEVWQQCLRVLKPGGHLLAFGGSRTYHRLACAIEDAGFEIRDQIMWVYGSGFPKSLDVSKAIDKAAGTPVKVGKAFKVAGEYGNRDLRDPESQGESRDAMRHHAVTDAAKQWDGWGTALKPAHEPIVLARKPLNGTVANNVLTHGVGALNINDCRVPGEVPSVPMGEWSRSGTTGATSQRSGEMSEPHTAGRWPANFIHDGSDEVLQLFPIARSFTGRPERKNGTINQHSWMGNGDKKNKNRSVVDASRGSAARFFYCAKASRTERNTGLDHLPARRASAMGYEIGLGEVGEGMFKDRNPQKQNFHPTVKPLALIHYLIKLITPPGGTILDPFLGSGTTAVAATQLGHPWIGCELTEDYWPIIEARIAHATQLT